MKIVNVKCPGCGAAIQLDADRETGFCSFCGSTVKVQEAIQKIKFDNSDLIKNNLLLAETALESKEFDKCVQLAEKVLEADTDNSRAWLLKLNGLTGSFRANDTSMVDKIKVCLKRLLAEEDNGIKNEAVDTVLAAVNGDFIYCYENLSDMSQLEAAKNEWVAARGLVGYKGYLADLDTEFSNSMLNVGNIAMSFYELIPSELLSDQTHVDLRSTIAFNYNQYYEAYKRRTSFYGAKLEPSAVQIWENELNQLLDGLPTDIVSNIKTEFHNTTNTKQKKGCAGMLAFLFAAGAGVSYGVFELVKNVFV